VAVVHHRYATVRGRRLFYREAGPARGPVVVLLHGFPASSFMFRDLIPRLAARYHVIAPDYLGFGPSDAPGAVTAVITQNGNGYEAGFTEAFWKPMREYWQDRNPRTEAAVRQILTLDAIRCQYLRDSKVPVLAIWGRNDPGFGPEGALAFAFAADAPGAEICLLDGGHFLLESHLDTVADHVRHFLGRMLS
jgi:pimeloyl-ACP methyl ester carboxylesterase